MKTASKVLDRENIELKIWELVRAGRQFYQPFVAKQVAKFQSKRKAELPKLLGEMMMKC